MVDVFTRKIGQTKLQIEETRRQRKEYEKKIDSIADKKEEREELDNRLKNDRIKSLVVSKERLIKMISEARSRP